MGGQKKKYDVYDKTDAKFILKNVDSHKVSETIGIPLVKISDYDSKGVLYKRRYRIVGKYLRIMDPEIIQEPPCEKEHVATAEDIQAMKEWDRVRLDPKLWRTIDANLLGDHKAKFRGKGKAYENK